MRIYENGIYRDMTEDEISQMQINQRKSEVYEKHRPLTEQEVSQMFIKQQVNTLDIDDQTSLRMIDYYPTFDDVIGQTVSQGFKFTYQGKLYKVIQASLLMQEQYYPQTGTESLYTRIDKEHDGDIYDPIPYSPNMELFKDKYYTQYDVLYLCTRDSQQPLYDDLADLIDIYVQVV